MLLGSRPKVKKSVNTLLDEVFNGNFNDFRAYLAQENVTDLVLAKKNLGARNLALLSTALQGTQVMSVDLMGTGIGPQGARDFAQNLQGTQVTTVYLSVNRIGDQGARDFAQHLQGTKVTTVELFVNQISSEGAVDFAHRIHGTQVTAASFGEVGPEAEIILRKALAKNNFRIHLAAPLLYSSMHTNETTRNLTVTKEYKNCSSEEEKLKFVWEILRSVPREVKFSIINKANRETGLDIEKAFTGFCKQRETRPIEERALLFEFKKTLSQEKHEAPAEEENGTPSKKFRDLAL